MTECSYKIKSQKMLHNETQKLAQYLEDLKKQEYEKIHYYFEALHKELDRREISMKNMYHEQVKDVQSILNKDSDILDNRMKEFEDILDKLKDKANKFKVTRVHSGNSKKKIPQSSISNDLAIVANAQEVFCLQRKIKNNNFEGKRLNLDDEYGQSNKEMNSDYFSYQPKSKFTTIQESSSPDQREQDNEGEHVFFVQLDSELPMPHFIINISKEKKKIESIGTIKKALCNNPDGQEENTESDQSKLMSDVRMNIAERPPLHQPRNGNAQEEVKEFMAHYPGIANSFYSKRSTAVKTSLKKDNPSYNDKINAEENNSTIVVTQNIIEHEETIVKSDPHDGRQMYWFKWDTYE